MNRSNIPAANDRFVFIFFLVKQFLAFNAPTRLRAPGIWLFSCHASLFPLLIGLFRRFNSWCSITSRCKSSYRVVALSFTVHHHHHRVFLRYHHFPRRAIHGISFILQPYRSITRITYS